MPITFVEQKSVPPDGQGYTPKVWANVTPTLAGLALSIAAWSFYYAGKRLDLPATQVTLSVNPTYASAVRLYIVPTFDGVDNYHLDEALQDGSSQPAAVEAFPEIGHMLLLWGTVPAGGPEAHLFCLRHVAE